MKKFLVATIMILLTAAPAIAQAANFETWYVGAASGLNCRSEPTTDAAVLTVYPVHAELQIIGVDASGAWWQSWDGETQGWVHSDYMVSSPDGTRSGVGTYLDSFYVTGYTTDPSENGGGTVNCFGEELEPLIGQIVAVDPSVIPLKTDLYIPGIGYRQTRDKGVYGNVIDVLVSSKAEAFAITGWYDVYLAE